MARPYYHLKGRILHVYHSWTSDRLGAGGRFRYAISRVRLGCYFYRVTGYPASRSHWCLRASEPTLFDVSGSRSQVVFLLSVVSFTLLMLRSRIVMLDEVALLDPLDSM